MDTRSSFSTMYSLVCSFLVGLMYSRKPRVIELHGGWRRRSGLFNLSSCKDRDLGLVFTHTHISSILFLFNHERPDARLVLQDRPASHSNNHTYKNHNAASLFLRHPLPLSTFFALSFASKPSFFHTKISRKAVTLVHHYSIATTTLSLLSHSLFDLRSLFRRVCWL